MDFFLIVKFFILFQVVTAKSNKVQVLSRTFPGNTATEGQFPYQGYFSYGEAFGCGGSIIHSRWALTAAHCILLDLDNPLFTVGTTYTFGSDGMSYGVELFIIHRNYKALEGPPIIAVYDIGLARLTSNIQFDNYKVKSIPLARGVANYDYQMATVAGWGDSQYGHISALLFINIPIAPISVVCHGLHASDELHVCGSNENQQQACMGDSGSPVVWNGQQIGIVSAAPVSCQGLGPTLFTRVSTFVPWIQEVLAEHNDYI